MPLLVYLDTSDYVAMYKGNDQIPSTVCDVKEYLLKMSKEKKIVVAYSYVVVWELLQKYEASYREDRLNRAGFVHDLCEYNTFRFFDRLVSEPPLSKNGEWYPNFKNRPLVRELKEALKKEIGKYVNRQQRRSFKHDRAFQHFIKENPHLADLSKAHEWGIPLPQSLIDSDVFYKYVTGEISEICAEAKFMIIMNDLRVFIDLWYDYMGKDNLLSPTIKKASVALQDAVYEFMKAYEKLSDLQRRGKILERTLRDIDMVEEAKKLRTQRVDLSKYEDIRNVIKFNHSIWEALPRHVPDIIVGYVQQRIKDGGKIKPSDVGDVFHSVYLPFCDLWRADKYFSDTLKRTQSVYKDKIVDSLESIPAEIDKRI